MNRTMAVHVGLFLQSPVAYAEVPRQPFRGRQPAFPKRISSFRWPARLLFLHPGHDPAPDFLRRWVARDIVLRAVPPVCSTAAPHAMNVKPMSRTSAGSRGRERL